MNNTKKEEEKGKEDDIFEEPIHPILVGVTKKGKQWGRDIVTLE